MVGQGLLYEALIKIHSGSFFSAISLWLYKNSKEYNLGTQIQKQPHTVLILGIHPWELPLSGLHLQESLPSSDPSPDRAKKHTKQWTTPTGYLGCRPEREHVVSGFCVVSPALSPSPCFKHGHLLFCLIWSDWNYLCQRG